MTTLSLEEHLASYGIRRFDSDQYWKWAGEKLGEKKAREMDALRGAVTQAGAKNRPETIRQFFDLAASPDIAPVIHSMKAGAIRASGEAVSRKIAGRKTVLDLGCGIGYLPAWYAGREHGRKVVGVDFSERSIAEASRLAQKIESTQFLVLDICGEAPPGFGPFDAIVDTQTLSMTRSLPLALKNIKTWITPGGTLVSVPVLETFRHARAFIRSLANAGFQLQSFEFMEYTDCGSRGAYPVLTAALEGKSIAVNWEDAYERMWQGLVAGR